MSAAIVNAFIWWAGALVWLGGFMFATAALCFACYRLCELSFRNLLRATRASTARYFINLDGELEQEESAQRAQAQQKGPAS